MGVLGGIRPVAGIGLCLVLAARRRESRPVVWMGKPRNANSIRLPAWLGDIWVTRDRTVDIGQHSAGSVSASRKTKRVGGWKSSGPLCCAITCDTVSDMESKSISHGVGTALIECC